jgi:hypothetical protein
MGTFNQKEKNFLRQMKNTISEMSSFIGLSADCTQQRGKNQ